MQEIFIKIFNMSISAGWIVIAVMLIRLFLKKAPKRAVIFLWAIVAVRLLCPFSPESVLSLIPSAETVPADIVYSQTPSINSGIPAIDGAVNPVISDSLEPDITASVNPAQTAVSAAALIWIAGTAAMLVYVLASALRVRRKIREAVKYGENIWLCDRISTPFIFGVFRPAVYIPFSLPEKDAEYVIAHEEAHLKRHDHIVKPFAFLLLCVYWFNPLLWAAYVLFCRDIELACDETVIEAMKPEEIKEYTSALLECSAPAKRISPCPLAFGETGVKSRIKAALNYKKPAVWVIAVSVAVCSTLTVMFLTNPPAADIDKIINQDGYTIFSQNLYDFKIKIPEGTISKNAYTENGQEFNNVLVYKEGITEIYLKKISLLDKYDFLYAEFCFDYGDLDKAERILCLDRWDNGFTTCLGVKSYDFGTQEENSGQSVKVASTGPDKNFALYISVEEAEKCKSSIEITLFCNEIKYSKSEAKVRGKYGIIASVSAAECEDVEYSFQYGTINSQLPYITAKWVNNSDDWLCFGDEFKLYRDGEPCKTKDGNGWNDILHTLAENAAYTENYYLNAYDISVDGDYRLEKVFYLESNPDKKYTAYINFKIERTYSFLGCGYKGEKIVYENGSYSSVLYTNENIPQFLIDDAVFSLLTNDYPEPSIYSSYYRIGILEKINLSKDNFDNLMTSEIWQDGFSAVNLRKNNLNAFKTSDESGRLYYLLEQRNGDIYVAQGYTDTYSIRWVFKMKEIEYYNNGNP